MRLGNYRVIFNEDANSLQILAVGDRRDIYRYDARPMKPQFITTDAGEELVLLSRREYDSLLARLGDEEAKTG